MGLTTLRRVVFPAPKNPLRRVRGMTVVDTTFSKSVDTTAEDAAFSKMEDAMFTQLGILSGKRGGGRGVGVSG